MNSSIYGVLSSLGWLGFIFVVAPFLAASPAYCGSDEDGVIDATKNLTRKVSNSQKEVCNTLAGHGEPNCSLGHENKKTSNSPEESKNEPNGFGNLVQEMSTDWDPCNRSEERTLRLRQRALQVMEDAIAYYQGRKPKKIEYSEEDLSKIMHSLQKRGKDEDDIDIEINKKRADQQTKFYYQMEKMWVNLKREVTKVDDSLSEKEKEEIAKENFSDFPSYSDTQRTNGVIFLPTFQNDFNSTALRQYFPIGIFPIGVKNISTKTLRRIPDHPFLPFASYSISQFVEHDFGHSISMLDTFSTLQMHKSEKCGQFKKCLANVPQQSRTLFNLIHEFDVEGEIFGNRGKSIDQNLFARVPRQLVVEIAVEMALERKDHKFSFDSFLGKGEDEINVCASIERLNNEISAIEDPSFEAEGHASYTSSDAKNELIRDKLLFISKDLFPFEGILPHRATGAFLVRLENICKADFPKGIPKSTDTNDGTLKNKFRAIGKEFASEVNKNITKQYNDIFALQGMIEKTPECKEFFYRK